MTEEFEARKAKWYQELVKELGDKIPVVESAVPVLIFDSKEIASKLGGEVKTTGSIEFGKTS